MAFADPQTVTVNAVAIALPRTGYQPNAGVFTSNDGLNKLTVSNTYGAKRTRRSMRWDFAKIAADPLAPALNGRFTGSFYIVLDQPVIGYTVAELKLQMDGFLAFLTASSGAKLTQLAGGEV
jgi:hypothetical protein